MKRNLPEEKQGNRFPRNTKIHQAQALLLFRADAKSSLNKTEPVVWGKRREIQKCLALAKHQNLPVAFNIAISNLGWSNAFTDSVTLSSVAVYTENLVQLGTT